LAFWKTRKGIPTKVYDISWIINNFPGYDTQEKIRNFLRLNDSTPRFDYLLLLGDTNTIPDRKCWSQDGDQVPCDYYFSDVVDGAYGSAYDWDTDNDHIWGEFSDIITWLPDIYVGRIASRSTSEVQTIINNIISYEKNPPVGLWPKKVVFGSAFANYPTRDYGATDMAAVPEHVRADFLDGAGVDYDRLYEAAGIYPTSYEYDYPLTASNFESRVGLGCGFAFPSGHGNYLGNYRLVWSWDNGNGYYDSEEGSWYPLATQSYNPSTGGMKPYVLVAACLAGEFDRTEPCYGDFVIANYGIGAVASSRTSYYCVEWDDPDWPWNQGQEYRWWEEIFSNGKYRLGQIHGDNKYHYAVDFNTLWDGDYGPDNDYASRKNMFSSNLFGDPELPVWTDQPANLSVAHDSSVPVGSSTFQVSVSSGGLQLPGATVCIWKGEEVYLVSQTNQSGTVSFSPSPSTPGVMLVTVTKHNYIPYEGLVTVEETDNEPPSVRVVVPNGGEVWDIGSTYEIRWIATDNVGVTTIDILLSRDGGVNFDDTLAIGIENDGSFLWEATYPASLNGRIKVVAYDAANNSGYDVGDADFEIYDPISNVFGPDGIPGQFFVSLSPNPASNSLLICFGLPNQENVRIDLYDVAGRRVAEILKDNRKPGYHWAEFTATTALSGIYFVRIEAGAKIVVEKVVIMR
ncbi:MAG: C25 family cysteine peptidase, partial [bacterium]